MFAILFCVLCYSFVSLNVMSNVVPDIVISITTSCGENCLEFTSTSTPYDDEINNILDQSSKFINSSK